MQKAKATHKFLHATTKIFLIFLITAGGGCGKDLIVDVNALPCGTAKGNAASGTFRVTFGAEENCRDILPYRPLTEETEVIVKHYEPGITSCPHGRLEMLFTSTGTTPEFTLKGGLWTNGSFRIGQAVTLGTQYVYRILMDGRYFDPDVNDPTQTPTDYFKGNATIEVDLNPQSEADKQTCKYEVIFIGDRR